MSDAWERLCEAVGATPETVFVGYKLVTRQSDPPAYLRPPNRERKRAIILAALGKRCRGYRYRNELDYDLPADVRDIRREWEWFDRFRVLHVGGLDIDTAARQVNEEQAGARTDPPRR